MDSEYVHGYKLVEENWHIANISDTIKAERSGKIYFLKRYTKSKKPIKSPSISEKGYARQLNNFNEFVTYRTNINKALREISKEGGNVVAPREEFNEDIYFIEATEFVDGFIPGDKINDLHLPKADILFAILTLMGAISNIHRKKIVHSDLKLSNVGITKIASGRYVGKAIDFDVSYFEDKLPDPIHLGGDAGYLSPELAACYMTDFGDEQLAYLSTKSDIFSLGLVFYNLLTNGKLPKLTDIPDLLIESKGEGNIYPGEGVASGAKLVIGKEIEEPYLRHLLAAMLQLEPVDRPDANKVVEVLKMKTILPFKADSNVIMEGDGTTHDSSKDKDSGVTAPGRFCMPWEEHHIEFDIDAIKKSGFICVRRIEKSGIKCYEFEKIGGVVRVYKDAQIKMMGWSHPEGEKPVKKEETPEPKKEEKKEEPVKEVETAGTTYDDSLWEKDSDYIYDMDAIKKDGYEKVGKTKKGTTEAYILETASGKQKMLSFNHLKMLGYVKKK